MKLKKYILLIIAGCVFLFSSCQKEDSDVFKPDNRHVMDTSWVSLIDPAMPVAILAADLSIPVYKDSIDIAGNTAAELITASGLKFSLPANCLTDYNNAPIKGKVDVQSLLIQKKGDMIRLNKSSKVNDYVIASEGMFLISLKKNGGIIQLAPQAKIDIRYSETQPTHLVKLFYGEEMGQGWLNWHPNTEPVNNITALNEGYEINTSKLGWINAGYTIDSNASQNISISLELAKHFTNANTTAWLVFKDYNAAVNLKADAAARKFSVTGIPYDKDATLVVISKQVDDYYLGIKDIFTSASGGNTLSVPVKPVKISLDDLLQYLNSL